METAPSGMGRSQDAFVAADCAPHLAAGAFNTKDQHDYSPVALEAIASTAGSRSAHSVPTVRNSTCRSSGRSPSSF